MESHELRQLLALASAFKEGDLAVGGTTDDRLREEARRALLATTVRDIHRTSIIDDGVTVHSNDPVSGALMTSWPLSP